MTWQPIETAPKNRTHILVWEPPWQRADGIMADGEVNRCFWRADLGWAYAWDDGSYSASPTHWMPLPEGPGGTDG